MSLFCSSSSMVDWAVVLDLYRKGEITMFCEFKLCYRPRLASIECLVTSVVHSLQVVDVLPLKSLCVGGRPRIKG